MAEFKEIDETISVAGQLLEEDIILASGMKYAVIINNRPDDEESEQPSSEQVEKWAQENGLAYHYLPVSKDRMDMENIFRFGDIYTSAEGPILAFCRSGMRSTSLWGLTMSAISTRPIPEIMDAATKLGYDLSTMKAPFEAVRTAVLKAQAEQL